jgi:flagellar assembly protein FliH
MMVSSKSRGHSRFIPSEEVGVVSEWQFGAVGAPLLAAAPVPEVLPEPEVPEEPVQVRIDRAWEEGFDAGQAQGRTEATNEGNHRLDAFVQGQGAETAQKLAELLSAMQSRLAQAEMDGKAAVVKLHPLDLEVLQEPLQVAIASPRVTWLPDASVERGGCLVESGGTVIDGTLSKRWERAVAQLGLASTWTDAGDGA